MSYETLSCETLSCETLLTSLTDAVARITLYRPEVRNALSRTIVAEPEAALAGFEGDSAARVIVLAGAGDQAFCAPISRAPAIARRRSRRVTRSVRWPASSKRSRGCGRR